MNNYRTLLEQQKQALQKDIDEMIAQISEKELELEKIKEKKSEASSALRSIEKKLTKV